MLKNTKIAVFVTGGIAAYKIPDLVRQLIKNGAEVRVAMTPAATRFVTPYTFEVLTRYPVLVEGSDYPDQIGHVALADWLDLALVVPATANTLAKMANGIGDNELTSTLLAVDKPLMIVPAMNTKMWFNPATQRNINILKEFGCCIIDPAEGFLAEGYTGKGRMPETTAIFAAVQALAALQKTEKPLNLAGQRVVISAGGTVEDIDPVRYISNRSSGKMGMALAHVAAVAGAHVTVVRTPSAEHLPVIPQINVVAVKSATEMYDQMHRLSPEADIIIMAAAVSDYRVANAADHKMKKDEAGAGLTLTLAETPDILASLPKDQAFVVGFAAETQNVEAYAKAKLAKKGAHMIVANNVGNPKIGFTSDENAVTIVTNASVHAIPQQSKYGVAAQIFNQIIEAKA